jgi:hypothetical protein
MKTIVITMLIFGLQLFAEDGLKQPVSVTTTDRVNFAPGGVIRLTTAASNLFIEAWDQPQVEITTTKSSPHGRCLDDVRVATERRSDTELAITATLPPDGFFSDPLRRKCGAEVQYQVRVPIDSRLVIHHGAGFIMISRVSGDIEVTSRSGDIVLMLPEPGPYSIDAKSKFGSVSSDFAGTAQRKKLIGEQFASPNATPSRKIHLRIGFGGITIKSVPPR